MLLAGPFDAADDEADLIKSGGSVEEEEAVPVVLMKMKVMVRKEQEGEQEI